MAAVFVSRVLRLSVGDSGSSCFNTCQMKPPSVSSPCGCSVVVLSLYLSHCEPYPGCFERDDSGPCLSLEDVDGLGPQDFRPSIRQLSQSLSPPCPARSMFSRDPCSSSTDDPPFLNNLRLLPVLVMAPYTQAPSPRGKRACVLVPSAWDQSVLCLSTPPGTGRVATRRCFVPFPHARCFSLSGREVCVGGREVQRLRPARRRAGGGEGHAGRVLSASSEAPAEEGRLQR